MPSRRAFLWAGRRAGARLAIALGTLLLISVITFAATNAVPANPALAALGKGASAAQVAQYSKQEGLDKPLVPRYFTWLGNYVRGDWGTSVLANRTSVTSEVIPRMLRTLVLGSIAMILSIALAFWIGVSTGRRSGSLSDLGTSLVTLIFNSLPEFVTAIAVLIVFGVWIGWFPIESGSGILFGHGWDQVKSYAMPVITLTLVLTPYLARMVRTNVREILQQPMVRGAVLRGLSRRQILWRHVVPNSAIPVVTVIALTMADILAGVVAVETVFAFPGIGNLFVTSVLNKDLPVVQAVALVVGAGFVLLNLTADLMLVVLDPRLRDRQA